MPNERIPTPAQRFALGLIASGEYRFEPNTRTGRHRDHRQDYTRVIRCTTLNVLLDNEWVTFAPRSRTELVCTEKGLAWRTEW